MNKAEFTYYFDQYFLPIINHSKMYHQLLLSLKADDFRVFCMNVDQFMQELKREHHLHQFDTPHRVYVRLMVLDYMYDTPQIERLRTVDSYVETVIGYCDLKDLGWLADKVFKRKPDPFTQPTEQTKEPEMSNKITFKTITYINNVDVTTLSDEQLIDAVKTIEAEIIDLKAVQTKSKKIEAKITEASATLDKVIEVLDAR